MGAWDLTYDCNASSFEDVVVYFEKLIEEQEKRGYDRDDPYCANITSFGGIKLLEGFAKNRQEALEEVLDKGEKWGPAVTKFYYPEGFEEYANKSDIKKRVNQITKLHTKLKNEHDKVAQYVQSTYDKVQSKENTNAINAKNNAKNEFNSAKENKSKAEQDVIEKKKLCSTSCK